MKVELYSSYGCTLCKEARRLLSQARERFGFEFVETDIRLSPDLYARYRYDIPVVVIDGQKALTHRFTEEELVARLRTGTSVAHPDADSPDNQDVPETYVEPKDE